MHPITGLVFTGMEPYVRRIAVALMMLQVAACALPTEIVRRPPEGLRAMRFVETVRLPGLVGNTYEIAVGTSMVQDRIRVSDGAPLWCGTIINQTLGISEAAPNCFTRNGRTITINAHVAVPVGITLEVPEGSFEDTRLR